LLQSSLWRVLPDRHELAPRNRDARRYRQLDLRYTAISPTNQRTIDR
jgi:hypothetical protein